ncbi:hypothetical protein HmCmsJML188_00155 [Escherichia coli]|nr:hypothetical protein HmCmsJML188_00155 [Escherichia coli]
MISAVTVQLGQTLGHGVSVQTGKVIISTPAATTMKMTAVTVQRVKTGTGAVITPGELYPL